MKAQEKWVEKANVFLYQNRHLNISILSIKLSTALSEAFEKGKGEFSRMENAWREKVHDLQLELIEMDRLYAHRGEALKRPCLKCGCKPSRILSTKVKK